MIDTKEITLYKRNAKGQPIFWTAKVIGNKIQLNFGIVGKQGTTCDYIPPRGVEKEWKTIVAAKRREGGIELSEVRDETPNIINVQLYSYLDTYLPKYNTTNEGFVLPQLAKIYEFDREERFFGQTKIDGVRANVSAYMTQDGMFSQPKLRFRSRKGLEYKCPNLETYLLQMLPKQVLQKMLDEDYVLDGELYIPNQGLNNVLSAAENLTNPLNQLLQFWCYDLAIEDMPQHARLEFLNKHFNRYKVPNYARSQLLLSYHLNNKSRFVLCNNYETSNDEQIIQYRNLFVEAGFEGIILRNPNSFYQFGKRNTAMFKCKPILDGKFKIIDIVPEGAKRPKFSKFILQNDINEETFECMPVGVSDIRKMYLSNRESYIGKIAFVEYRTRSGVKQVPAHANVIRIEM